MTTLRPTREDVRYAARKSTSNCVIARAGGRTWGGAWTVGLGGATQQIGTTVNSWGLRARDKARMSLYDSGGPWLPGPVKLIKRGPARTLRRAAVPAGAGAAWLAVSAGFGGLLLALVYTACAVAGYLVLGAFGKAPVPGTTRISETDASRRSLFHQMREAQQREQGEQGPGRAAPLLGERGTAARQAARELMARGVGKRPEHVWPAPARRPGPRPLTSPYQMEIPAGLTVSPDSPPSARAGRAREAPAPEPAGV